MPSYIYDVRIHNVNLLSSYSWSLGDDEVWWGERTVKFPMEMIKIVNSSIEIRDGPKHLTATKRTKHKPSGHWDNRQPFCVNTLIRRDTPGRLMYIKLEAFETLTNQIKLAKPEWEQTVTKFHKLRRPRQTCSHLAIPSREEELLSND